MSKLTQLQSTKPIVYTGKVESVVRMFKIEFDNKWNKWRIVNGLTGQEHSSWKRLQDARILVKDLSANRVITAPKRRA